MRVVLEIERERLEDVLLVVEQLEGKIERIERVLFEPKKFGITFTTKTTITTILKTLKYCDLLDNIVVLIDEGDMA